MSQDLNAPIEGVEDALARCYPPATNEPCNECPWRREATAGYLGPHDAIDWLITALGESPIACHKTIPAGGGWGPRTLQCRGAAIFRANICKTPHNPTIETGPPDKEKVFARGDEFYDHHDGQEAPDAVRAAIAERMYG